VRSIVTGSIEKGRPTVVGFMFTVSVMSPDDLDDDNRAERLVSSEAAQTGGMPSGEL